MRTQAKKFLWVAMCSSAVLAACSWFLSAHRTSSAPQAKLSANTTTSGQPYQITERTNNPAGYLALDVLVLANTDTTSLRRYATSIVADEKITGRVVIWFYNGNTNLGTYDSKNNSLSAPHERATPTRKAHISRL